MISVGYEFPHMEVDVPVRFNFTVDGLDTIQHLAVVLPPDSRD